MKNLFLCLIAMIFSSFAYSQQKSIGEVHNELLNYMMTNYDESSFKTFDKHIEIQYDYLSKQYPELMTINKQDFVKMVSSLLNTNIISDFNYQASVKIALDKSKNSGEISQQFYDDAINILYDKTTDGSNIEDRIKNIRSTSDIERTAISYALDTAKHSKEYWGETGKRNWTVWGSDQWGSFVGGISAGVLGGPIVGFVVGVAAGELMSWAVGTQVRK